MKFTYIFRTGIIFVFFFACISGGYTLNDQSLKSEEIQPNRNYIEITENIQSGGIINKDTTLVSASYVVGYSFHSPLFAPWREFGAGSICFRSNPVATMSFVYDDRFRVKLVKDTLLNTVIGEKIFRVNEGLQSVKWTGIPAGNYRLEMEKYIKSENYNGIYFYDNSAIIENC